MLLFSVAPDNMRIEGPEGVQQDTVNVFKCHVAIGNPPPEVFWIVEDEDGDRREDGDTLMLSTKVTRTVLMSCHAENSEGKLTESRRVPVHHLPAFVTISLPTIVENTILEGGLVSADCTAAPAQPKPNLVWKVEDGRGNQVLDGIRIVQDGRGVSSFLSLLKPKTPCDPLQSDAILFSFFNASAFFSTFISSFSFLPQSLSFFLVSLIPIFYPLFTKNFLTILNHF